MQNGFNLQLYLKKYMLHGIQKQITFTGKQINVLCNWLISAGSGNIVKVRQHNHLCAQKAFDLTIGKTVFDYEYNYEKQLWFMSLEHRLKCADIYHKIVYKKWHWYFNYEIAIVIIRVVQQTFNLELL